VAELFDASKLAAQGGNNCRQAQRCDRKLSNTRPIFLPGISTAKNLPMRRQNTTTADQ
jgi:hypothetical protein